MDPKKNVIARADMCYGYNNDNGCNIWDIPSCRHANETFMISSTNIRNSDTNVSIVGNNSLALSDCKDSCWNDCNCLGFTSYNADGTGCVFYKGKSWERVHDPGGDRNFCMIVVTPLGENTNDAGSKKWIRITVVIATILFICSGGFILWLAQRKRNLVLKDKRQKMKEKSVVDLVTFNATGDVKELQNNNGHEFRIFSYESVLAATNNFSSGNKLGEGGFGPVYKGQLEMGKEVAVKRLSRSSKQGIIEFKTELTLISELQHTNLVQLLGCCIHEEERILIYEYMPNKSLDFFLFDSAQCKLLDWKKRFDIVEGIAQGFLYLHKYSRLKVIHRDLKASNILLDENFNPKISDFGMARIFTHEIEYKTNRIVGTYGYMSPEYAMEGVFSIKSDVYSFGVLMLEIVSGRRNKSFYSAECPHNLVRHAWDLWKEGMGLQLMDPAINDSFNQDQVLRCIHIGWLCVEQFAVDRPTMSEVLVIFTNETATLPLPKGQAFLFGRRVNAEKSQRDSILCSINELSISDFSAR